MSADTAEKASAPGRAMPFVRVYSTGPRCMQCKLTCDLLEAEGIAYERIELSTAPAAREYVTEELGYYTAPVVVVEDEPENHWTGFRPEFIKRLGHGAVTS